VGVGGVTRSRGVCIHYLCRNYELAVYSYEYMLFLPLSALMSYRSSANVSTDVYRLSFLLCVKCVRDHLYFEKYLFQGLGRVFDVNAGLVIVALAMHDAEPVLLRGKERL